MKKLKFLFLLAAAAVVVPGCVLENAGDCDMVKRIEFSADGMTAYMDGEEIDPTFPVNTTGVWEVSSDQEWCWAEAAGNAAQRAASGQAVAQGDKITVYALPNEYDTPPAPAVITVTSGSATPLKVYVTQRARTGFDVYFTGFMGMLPTRRAAPATQPTQALYWKNGVGKQLHVPEGHGEATPTSIAVQGDKILVGGYYRHFSYYDYDTAVYWLNDVMYYFNLPTADNVRYNGVCSSVFIEKGVLYGAGSYNYEGKTQPCIWKNNVLTNLGFEGDYGATTREMFVNGGTVYLAGADEQLGPCYWKDTDQNLLTDDDYYTQNVAMAGRDIYVSGSSLYGYWKNKVWNDAPSFPDDAYGNYTSVRTHGSDIYIGGKYTVYPDDGDPIAYLCYWKNGQRTDFDMGNDYEFYFELLDIRVSGGKVFFWGRGDSGFGRAPSYILDGVQTVFDVPEGVYGDLQLTDMCVVPK